MDIVREIISPSKKYKTEIIRWNDGLFHVEIFTWEDEWDCWSRSTRNLSLTDIEAIATEIAIEELHNRTGEDITF